MKLPSKFTALVCCVVLIVLAGEGTTLRGQTTGFVYVANLGSSNVSAYTINGTTGALAAAARPPLPAGKPPPPRTPGPHGPVTPRAQIRVQPQCGVSLRPRSTDTPRR